MPNYARKRDHNQTDIMQAVRGIGPLYDTFRFGAGFPDFILGVPWELFKRMYIRYRWLGGLVLVECKMPGQTLDARERQFHNMFAGYPILGVHSPQELQDIICGNL